MHGSACNAYTAIIAPFATKELKHMAPAKQSARKILVTSALPYANGPLHIGHMVGYIQADIWVRFQKMQGHDCAFVCGSDSHGTPIMIQAQ